MASVVDVARRYWAAEASRDLDRIMAFFHDQAEWGSATEMLSGKAQIRQFYADSAERFPGLEVEVGRAIGGPDEAAIEWRAIFTDKGGRRYPLNGVNLIRVENDLIVALKHYEDPTPLSRAPAPVLQRARTDRFLNHKILVTGAGGGIGAATVRQFLAEGAEVTAVDMNEAGLEYQRRALGTLAERYVAIVADITQADAQRAIVERATGRDGVLHVLVNNAAVFLMGGTNATDHQWRRTVDVNLIAPAQLASVAADALGRGGNGAIVNVASISAHVAGPNRWTYNSSKGGIRALTQCQALDLAPRGVRVNSVSPGYTWTDVLDTAAGGNRAKWDAIWGAACPMRRCAEPHEVANVIAFLASQEASYVTGTDVLVDGGMVSMAPDGLTPYEFGS
jgi:NAD(P)-dependent dehydrogenase (short-subunit alcohol dehydrogenase family)/ketosteroid isomerase-like protein